MPLVPLLEARTLVSIMKNKAAFNPPLAAIKEKCFAKFRGKGKEKVDTPPPATPTSGAGASGRTKAGFSVARTEKAVPSRGWGGHLASPALVLVASL